ncbi:MAG: hypothetical protein ACRD0H_29535, partial [Actinomycetes bacterium]
ATLQQLDNTRTLDLRQWAHPSTLGTAAGTPHDQPTGSRTEVPVAISTHPADQLNSQTSMASPGGQRLAMPPAAETPAPAPTVPTAAATNLSAEQRSLISRVMAGED